MTGLYFSNCSPIGRHRRLLARLPARGVRVLEVRTDRVKDAAVRNRLKPVLAPMKNREERVAFLTDVVAKPATQAAPQTKLFNRDGKSPSGGKNANGENTGAERERAQRITNRAVELQKIHNNLNAASAVIMAQREIES